MQRCTWLPRKRLGFFEKLVRKPLSLQSQIIKSHIKRIPTGADKLDFLQLLLTKSPHLHIHALHYYEYLRGFYYDDKEKGSLLKRLSYKHFHLLLLSVFNCRDAKGNELLSPSREKSLTLKIMDTMQNTCNQIPSHNLLERLIVIAAGRWVDPEWSFFWFNQLCKNAEMNDKQIDMKVYNSLLHLCSTYPPSAKDYKNKGIELYKSKILPTKSPRDFHPDKTYDPVLSLYASKGDVEGIHGLIKLVQENWSMIEREHGVDVKLILITKFLKGLYDCLNTLTRPPGITNQIISHQEENNVVYHSNHPILPKSKTKLKLERKENARKVEMIERISKDLYECIRNDGFSGTRGGRRKMVLQPTPKIFSYLIKINQKINPDNQLYWSDFISQKFPITTQILDIYTYKISHTLPSNTEALSTITRDILTKVTGKSLEKVLVSLMSCFSKARDYEKVVGVVRIMKGRGMRVPKVGYLYVIDAGGGEEWRREMDEIYS